MTPTRLFLALALCFAGAVSAAEPPKPKLVVNIAIDQFRYDYLPRFREHYTV